MEAVMLNEDGPTLQLAYSFLGLRYKKVFDKLCMFMYITHVLLFQNDLDTFQLPGYINDCIYQLVNNQSAY